LDFAATAQFVLTGDAPAGNFGRMPKNENEAAESTELDFNDLMKSRAWRRDFMRGDQLRDAVAEKFVRELVAAAFDRLDQVESELLEVTRELEEL